MFTEDFFLEIVNESEIGSTMGVILSELVLTAFWINFPLTYILPMRICASSCESIGKETANSTAFPSTGSGNAHDITSPERLSTALLLGVPSLPYVGEFITSAVMSIAVSSLSYFPRTTLTDDTAPLCGKHTVNRIDRMPCGAAQKALDEEIRFSDTRTTSAGDESSAQGSSSENPAPGNADRQQSWSEGTREISGTAACTWTKRPSENALGLRAKP